MKLRESGMPDEAYWETLFDVELILDRLVIDRRLGNVVELGCGYGTFTLPVARRISGLLRTFDIEPDMVARVRQRAIETKLTNIVCERCDVLEEGFGVPEESQDACLLFNILHCEQPVRLLAEAAKAVRSGGWVLVIHWRHDPSTPRGPNLAIRPRGAGVVEETNLEGRRRLGWTLQRNHPHQAAGGAVGDHVHRPAHRRRPPGFRQT